jgi:hypothetical protein
MGRGGEGEGRGRGERGEGRRDGERGEKDRDKESTSLLPDQQNAASQQCDRSNNPVISKQVLLAFALSQISTTTMNKSLSFWRKRQLMEKN